MNYKLSLITSLYNVNLADFKDCLNSVMDDEFFSFCEWIIVDDGKNDQDLLTYLISIKNINLIHNLENIGLTLSLNKAIEIVSSPIIVRIDHDDLFLVNRLRTIFKFFEQNNNIVLRCSGYKVKFGDSIKTYSIDSQELFFKHFIFENPILHSSVAFRTEVNGMKVYYNADVRYAQDFVLWLDLLERGSLYISSNVEVLRNILLGGISLSTNSLIQLKTGLFFRLKYIARNREYIFIPLILYSSFYQFLILLFMILSQRFCNLKKREV